MFGNWKAGRTAWWLSLVFLVGSLALGYRVHISGLSFWLERVDFWHTTGAAIIGIIGFSLFALVSIKRIQDMRAPKSLIWLMPILPLWILVMGLVPSATDKNPEPYSFLLRRVRFYGLIFVAVSTVASISYFFIRLNKPETVVPGVEESDDFSTYSAEFAAAANSLIAQGRCTPEDFKEMGGWWKSTTHSGEPIYFTYCGGTTVDDRIYLNAETGNIFR